MKRILIANGSFSALVLSAIFKTRFSDNVSNFFLGYFKNFSDDKSQKLFDFVNLLIKTDKNLRFFDYKTKFGFNFNKLNRSINTTTVDEIYIPINSSTKKIYKSFKNQYPNANFIFYEEGLMSYIKPLLDKPLRKIMEKYDSYYLFYDEKLKKLLIDSFPSIKYNTIIKEDFISKINEIQKIIPYFNYLSDTKRYALVLPQYYHQGNKEKTKNLLSQYSGTIQELIKNGYIVIFKDHPKAKIKYSDILKTIFNKDDFILFENLGLNNFNMFPVEVIANIFKIDLIFSVYSTSLFTFKYIYNIPTYTSTKMLNERMNVLSIYPTLSALITKNIINNLFDNSINTKNILYTENKILKILILMLKFFHKYK